MTKKYGDPAIRITLTDVLELFPSIKPPAFPHEWFLCDGVVLARCVATELFYDRKLDQLNPEWTVASWATHCPIEDL